MSERTQKLVSIRKRTDQDLLVLIDRELARGFALVDVAASRNSASFTQAEKSISTATALFSRISELSQDERNRLEGSLASLRSRLDRVPVYANVPCALASVAS